MLMTAILATAVFMAPSAGAMPPDPHSYANAAAVVVRAATLDLGVNFADKRIEGTVELKLDWKTGDKTALVLDTRDLDIESVEALDAAGATHIAKFALDKRDPILGSA